MTDLIDKDYILNVGPNSTFQHSGSYQSKPEDVDQMFLNFENSKTRKIALYFHGGLVNEEAGLNDARKVGPLISASGCARHPLKLNY